MRVCFFHSDKPRERLLADAFIDGVKGFRDEGFKRPLGSEFVGDFEVACMVGVKSRELIQRCWSNEIHTVYLDKGYFRHSAKGPVKVWQYWRVAVDAHHPTDFVTRARCKGDRWDNFRIGFEPWKSGTHIVIAGSSQKYHDFYGLYEPTKFAHKLVTDIKKRTMRPIVYRPKPSWKGAEPIDGTRYSDGREGILDVLQDAHALVTHGSNACFEAALNGIPSIILGDGVARPISSTSIDDINSPYLATDAERYQWFSNLAWCQFTMREFASGKAWDVIRPQIYG